MKTFEFKSGTTVIIDNLVISFGAARPAFVTTEKGYTWVDASHLPLIPFSLFYRKTLLKSLST